MKNSLKDLNDYLFEQMERLNDDSLTEEQLDREIRKTDSIVQVSETIIANSELMYKAMKHLDDYGYRSEEGTSMPLIDMVGGKVVRHE